VFAGVVQIAIVQDDVLEADLRTLGIDVQLADGLRLIAVAGELGGDGDGIVPRTPSRYPTRPWVRWVNPVYSDARAGMQVGQAA
jgi:hypothetical protein